MSPPLSHPARKPAPIIVAEIHRRDGTSQVLCPEQNLPPRQGHCAQSAGPEPAVTSEPGHGDRPRTALPSPPHSHGLTDLKIIYRPELHRDSVLLLWQRGMQRAPSFPRPEEAVRGSSQQEPWVTLAVRGMGMTGWCCLWEPGV